MLLNAAEVKKLLEDGPIYHILQYAQKAYPSEACGFVLIDGVIFPAMNEIARLNDSSLNTKNAFLIDSETFREASSREIPIVCIYHSHSDGSADMSMYDKASLCFDYIYYIIIGVFDHRPISAKLHWWNNKELNSIDINLQKEAQ